MATTRLTQEEQAAVLYWPEIADIPIIDKVNSRTKQVWNTGWPSIDFSNVDFRAKLANGDYDNGIAIPTGKTLTGKYAKYLVVIDFDGIDAIEEWFGRDNNTWEQVLDAAKRTRIEWHQDKSRLHMFLLLDRPIASRKIHIKNSLLEIRCEGQLVFAWPSIHKEGNRYTALETSEIVILSEQKLFGLEAKIESLCEGYMSDNNKQAYTKWLEDPANYTKFGVGQGRHNALVHLGTAYFYRYHGEWRGLTDEQRRARLWEWNNKLAVPKPEAEFNSIWKWIVEKHRRTRDELHERLEGQRRDEQAALEFDKSYTFSVYHDNVQASLKEHMWTEIGKNPNKWIVADSKMKVIYKAHQYEYEITTKHGNEEVSEKVCKLSIDNIIIRSIPISIVKHENPLDFLQKETNFTIQFKDTTGKMFTLVRKNIEQIMNHLKSEGYIMPGYGATEALAAIITAFREDKKLVIDKTINTMGLYWIDNELVPVGLDEYLNNYFDGLITIEKKKETIEFVEKLVTKFRPGIVSTALKIGVISPADFALKQYTNDIIWIPSLFTFGWPRTGKTTVAVLPSALYFPYMSQSRKRPFTSINSEARLGYFMCQDTLPACVNEMKVLNERKDYRSIIMIEMLKSTIETREARSIMNNLSSNNTVYPAFRQVNFSSNAPPPRDIAFRARLIMKNFTQKDSHNEEQKKEFHEFMGMNAYRLRALGDFAIGYLCEHPEILFKPEIEKIDWEESAKEIICKFYESCGDGMPRPEWIDSPLKDADEDEDYEIDELNNTSAMLKTVLLNHFNEGYNRYIRNLGEVLTDSNERIISVRTDLNLKERIDFCINKDITPHFKINSKRKLVILHSILDEFEKEGIDSDIISSLKQLAEILEMDCGTLHLNGRDDKGVRCVYGDIQKLYDFLLGDDYS